MLHLILHRKQSGSSSTPTLCPTADWLSRLHLDRKEHRSQSLIDYIHRFIEIKMMVGVERDKSADWRGLFANNLTVNWQWFQIIMIMIVMITLILHPEALPQIIINLGINFPFNNKATGQKNNNNNNLNKNEWEILH